MNQIYSVHFNVAYHWNRGDQNWKAEQTHLKYQYDGERLIRKYRVIKMSLCTWWFYCNRQVHRDFLITCISDMVWRRELNYLVQQEVKWEIRVNTFMMNRLSLQNENFFQQAFIIFGENNHHSQSSTIQLTLQNQSS